MSVCQVIHALKGLFALSLVWLESFHDCVQKLRDDRNVWEDNILIIDAGQEIYEYLEDDDNLPECVQAKITKATDYIDSVRDYLKSENEEVEECGKVNV